jgi:NADH-quinone oxidoreductase subunit G
MAYGPGESRFVEEKRHYPKPIPISDLVLLDRERCILCARCTRFSEEISGDPLIEFKDRGNYTQVNTFPDEPFASYFSGNTVQICPVGALTATAYRFRARPWDLEAVESTCPHCSVGCRISVQASGNQILRFIGVDNDATNQGWLCDKGRFGFEYLNSEDRLAMPLLRDEDGEFSETDWGTALDLVAERLGGIVAEYGAGTVAGLGGARGTNEDAYVFGRFLRSTVGTPHLDAQLGDGLDARVLAGITKRGTIANLERAATILVWAPDLKEELPVLYLRVRRAATELGAQLIVAHPRCTGLDDVADHVLRHRPGAGTDLLRRLAAGEGELAAARRALDEGPVVAVVGRPGLTDDPRLAEAVLAFAAGLPEASLLPVTRRSNVYGALDMGLDPGLLPGRVAADGEPGRNASGIIEGLESGELKALLLAGADPVRDYPDPERAAAALDAAEFVVAVDLFLTDSSRRADVVLPALGFAESEGTVTNLEGRVQKVNRLVPGPGQAREVWEVFEDLARRMGGGLGVSSAAAVAGQITAEAPAYAGIGWEELAWGEGREGIVVPARGSQPLVYEPVDRAPAPAARDLVLHLGRVLYDHGTLTQAGPSLAKLAPQPRAYLHPSDANRLGVVEGSAVRLSGSGGEAELPAAFDAGLVPGTVYLPFNLGVSIGPGLEVGLEVVT